MNSTLQKTLSKFRGVSARGAYLRPIEIAGVAILVVAGLGAYALYQNVAAPSYARVRELDKQCQDLKTKAEKLREDRLQAERDQKSLGSALNEIKRFEETALLERRAGQLALIDEINALARKTNVRIPESIAFEAADGAADAAAAPGRSQTKKDDKRPSRYPTLNVAFGVVGSYQQLRQFIRGLEQSRQFVILNLLTVEPNTDGAAAAPAAALGAGGLPANPNAGVNPNDISVGLSLTAYFRG
jgi:hypothetical protein